MNHLLFSSPDHHHHHHHHHRSKLEPKGENSKKHSYVCRHMRRYIHISMSWCWTIIHSPSFTQTKAQKSFLLSSSLSHPRFLKVSRQIPIVAMVEKHHLPNNCHRPWCLSNFWSEWEEEGKGAPPFHEGCLNVDDFHVMIFASFFSKWDQGGKGRKFHPWRLVHFGWLLT